jgi:predicted phosphoribosyltransferase
VIALPVAPKDTVETLRGECDTVVTGTSPTTTNFGSVGQYYREFGQVEDSEVVKICKRRGLLA